MSDSEQDDKLLLQTIKKSTDHCEPILQDEVKKSFSDDELEDGCEDPLHDNVDDPIATRFQGEYTESDFINEQSEDDQSKLQHTPSRSKRSKPNGEFKAPNGRVWSINKSLHKQAVLTDSILLSQLAAGKGPATKVKNALEAWYLLLDERILAIILAHTNEKIRTIKGKSFFEKTTDVVELRAWLGLNYLCGIFRNTLHPGPLNELWTWELGNSIFRATMSWKRFKFLAECISFGEPSAKKGTALNFLQIKEVWELFLANCRSFYSPSGNCVVHNLSVDIEDDQESANLTLLCDAKSLYICNALVSNLLVSKKSSERVLLHLVADIKGSNRIIVLPDLFTSGEICSLFQKRQLFLVGALPKKSDEIPKVIIENEANQTFYSNVGCLVRRNENASSFLLSNASPGKVAVDRLFDISTRSCDRLEQVIQAFNANNGSIEALNNRALTFFYRIMNFAATNAWVLLRLSTSATKDLPTQREFQRNLGLYLTQMQLKRQLQERNKLTLPQKLQICEVLGEPTEKLLSSACEEAKKNSAKGFVPTKNLILTEGLVLMSKTLDRRKRCCICSKYQTRTRCQQCLRALCYRHLIARCNDCMGVTELPE